MAPRSLRSRKLSNVGWSVIGWVTKNLLSRAPPCIQRYVKLLVPVAFAVVSTHQLALGPRVGLWPVLHNEGLGPRIGAINRLIMIFRVPWA
jgi:hypothetical protein